MFARSREGGNGALSLNYLTSQLSQQATTVPFATTGSSIGTEWPSAFSQQWAPSNKWESGKELQPSAVHAHARLPLSILNETSCTSKQLSTYLYLSGPHAMNSKGQWLPPFLKAYSHMHASMQNNARDGQQAAAANTFNWFQLAATTSSFLWSACCWTAH